MTTLNQSRFRFGLRTLFVLATITGVCLAWNIYRVREHNRLAVLLSNNNGIGGTLLVAAWTEESEPGWKAKTRSRLPILWRLLGALPVDQINLDENEFSEMDVRYYTKLFPEATVYWEDVR